MSLHKYGPHPLQAIKVYSHNSANKRTIVFIHGGAWRDPTNTFDDFDKVTSYIKRKENVNLIGINYRLSPEIKHPYHLVDVVDALNYIVDKFGCNEVLLAGHSVGATLVLQLLNYRALIEIGFSYDTKPGVEVKPLRVKFASIFLLDGIFDNVELIKEFGGPYEDFVQNAFVSKDQYSEATQVSSKHLSHKTPFEIVPTLIIIVQSLQDELLALRQVEVLVKFFKDKKTDYQLFTGDWGLHNEMYTRKEVGDIIISNI